jgi:methylthioribose-1-phosphate isomerase
MLRCYYGYVAAQRYGTVLAVLQRMTMLLPRVTLWHYNLRRNSAARLWRYTLRHNSPVALL